MNYKLLGALFLPRVIRRLADDVSLCQCDRYSKRVCECPHSVGELVFKAGYKGSVDVTLGELFNRVYAVLQRRYRNEYVYKNALVLHELRRRGRESWPAILSEFYIAECRADLVICNETPEVYEIKTEFDCAGRLGAQLQAYYSVCDRVTIVTHRKAAWLGRLEREIDPCVGLITFDRGEFQCERPSMSKTEQFEIEKMFWCLRQPERSNIVRRKFGYVPDVPNTLISTETAKLLRGLEPLDLFREMSLELSLRGPANPLAFIKDVPHSLKLLAAFARLTRKQREVFSAKLADPLLWRPVANGSFC